MDKITSSIFKMGMEYKSRYGILFYTKLRSLWYIKIRSLWYVNYVVYGIAFCFQLCIFAGSLKNTIGEKKIKKIILLQRLAGTQPIVPLRLSFFCEGFFI